MVPAVLYQGFQIVFGQISVQIIRDWRMRALKAAEAAEVYKEEETLAAKDQAPSVGANTADIYPNIRHS